MSPTTYGSAWVRRAPVSLVRVESVGAAWGGPRSRRTVRRPLHVRVVEVAWEIRAPDSLPTPGVAEVTSLVVVPASVPATHATKTSGSARSTKRGVVVRRGDGVVDVPGVGCPAPCRPTASRGTAVATVLPLSGENTRVARPSAEPRCPSEKIGRASPLRRRFGKPKEKANATQSLDGRKARRNRREAEKLHFNDGVPATPRSSPPITNHQPPLPRQPHLLVLRAVRQPPDT